MRRTGLCLAALGVIGLAACQESGGPAQLDLAGATLAPIPGDYRDQIVVWARGFYAEPQTLRDGEITDPVLMRDRTGRLLWLVCAAAESRARDGAPMARQRQAFGFAPNFLSAPLDRKGTTLVREDCDERPLTWRPWPELDGARGGSARSTRRVAGSRVR